MLKPVEKKKAYEDIVQQIRTLIEEGILKRNDHLPSERDLSETFRVEHLEGVEEIIFRKSRERSLMSLPHEFVDLHLSA